MMLIAKIHQDQDRTKTRLYSFTTLKSRQFFFLNKKKKIKKKGKDKKKKKMLSGCARYAHTGDKLSEPPKRTRVKKSRL